MVDQSTSRSPLTVLIPCGDEEKNIEACLRSVTWADEILVVMDAAGRDGSEEICRRYTDRILRHEYVNSAAQKNWSLPHASHPWVLVVDADERVTPALRDRIRDLLARDGDGCSGFRVQRRSFFLGRQIRFCGWGRDALVRLFRRDAGRYADLAVHADVQVDGRVGDIREHFLHDTTPDLNGYFAKSDRYTTWSAQDLFRRGRRAGVLNLFFRPLYRFFRMYVLQLGFLEGKRGLILCGLAAMSVFTKYAKLYDMRRRGGTQGGKPPETA
jgi:glycosyltransferase involved in cell wall biosynthesis